MTEKLALPAVLENLEPALDFIEKCAGKAFSDREFLSQIRLVCEEALVNIISYAYPGASGGMEVQCGPEQGVFRIRILDSGVPFNPFERPDPDVNKPVEEREIGGLGIFLIKKIMDSWTYRREGDRNIMTLEKKLA